MKKFIGILVLLLFASNIASFAEMMSFEQAMKESKPFAVMIYAPWADGLIPTNTAFDELQQKYATEYNFAKIDIATKEAKVFNKTYTIYPNLPYVLLFRNGGKITRYLPQECVQDNSCATQRMDSFIQK